MKTYLFPFLLHWICLASHAQKVSSRPVLEQGQVYDISLQMKTTVAQQAMGQAIDFTVDATGHHSFKVTNATASNNTLNHVVQRVMFTFDGMGQKRNFDSNNEKDMNGQFGKPVKELLDKKYDMVIDSGGTTLMAIPEKVDLSKNDPRMDIIVNMIKDVFNLVQPPRKGAPSFFKVLPDTEVGIGEPWTVSTAIDNGKMDAAYNVSDINDSTIVVDFATSSSTVTKAEMMGSEVTTSMNSKSTGKIILDRVTGIIKEKTETMDSTGSSETSFGTLPVTSKTTSTITVKKAD